MKNAAHRKMSGVFLCPHNPPMQEQSLLSMASYQPTYSFNG
jgi:hypothetical protein